MTHTVQVIGILRKGILVTPARSGKGEIVSFDVWSIITTFVAKYLIGVLLLSNFIWYLSLKRI